MTPSPGNRATEFLAAFNTIEQHLRSTLKAKDSDGMSWLSREAGKRRMLSPGDAEDLQEYAQLRNAISHGEYTPDLRPIADPLPETVAHITAIRDRLLHPPLALAILGPHQVRTLAPGDAIDAALSVIRETTISQFPVYDGKRYLGLLTTNSIARWVAADLGDNSRVDARTVSEVLEFAEETDTAAFLPRTATAQEVLHALTAQNASKPLPSVVILTETGTPGQKPLRVIGATDLMELVRAVT